MTGQEIFSQVVATVLTVGPLLLAFRVSLEHRLTKLEIRVEELFERRKEKRNER